MHDLIITRITPIAPGSESAEVTLSSGQGELVAFCWPCAYSVGDRVPNRVSAALLNYARAPYFVDWPEDGKDLLSKERLERSGPFGYIGCGTCIDQSNGLVRVNGFVFDFGEVPGDGPIEFDIQRLDLV